MSVYDTSTWFYVIMFMPIYYLLYSKLRKFRAGHCISTNFRFSAERCIFDVCDLCNCVFFLKEL